MLPILLSSKALRVISSSPWVVLDEQDIDWLEEDSHAGIPSALVAVPAALVAVGSAGHAGCRCSGTVAAAGPAGVRNAEAPLLAVTVTAHLRTRTTGPWSNPRRRAQRLPELPHMPDLPPAAKA